jgi:hypothetical protein
LRICDLNDWSATINDSLDWLLFKLNEPIEQAESKTERYVV